MRIPTKVNVDTEQKQSGAGAEVTALAESLQAYACATRQFLGKDLTDVSQITSKTIVDADCDRTLSACMKGLDEKWFSSVVRTANQIFVDVPGSSKGKNFKFYRGGTFVNAIYNEWRRMKEGSGISGDDKWNPADIWMAKKDFELKTGWPTLRDYNRYVYDSFANTELIGISLKKLASDGGATSKIFNNGKPLVAQFTGVKLGMNMTDSKDIYITYNSEGKGGEVQLRNFSSRPQPSSWQGEIKGKTAAGGKIGGGIVMAAAKESGIPAGKLILPSQTPILKPTEQDFKMFATAFKELSGSKETIPNLIVEAKAKHREDKTWWMSKFIGVMFVSVIIKQNKVDAVCKYIYEYASSATKNSSIFIKYS